MNLADIFVSPAEDEAMPEPDTAVADLAELAAQVDEVKQLLLTAEWGIIVSA